LILTTTFGLVGSVFGQDSNAQIEQSRLFQRTVPQTPNVNADGMALPQGEELQSTDDSFGKQQILKTEEKVRDFTLGASASEFYTSNAALTRSDTISDSFFVGNVGFSRKTVRFSHWPLKSHPIRYHALPCEKSAHKV